MIANISSGANLAMRYFTQGTCEDTKNNSPSNQSISCSHLKSTIFEAQWPFSNRLLLLINDQRPPSIPFLDLVTPPISMKLRLTDANKGKIV